MHLIRAIFCLFTLLLSTQLYSQSIKKIELSAINKDSLKTIYGNNKHFVPEYELQSLIALSFYPELINTIIIFKLADKESTAKTTIKTFSILNRTNKHFIIYINNNKNRIGIILQDAPFQAQVGAIGHELAHVSDFNKKNLLGITWWAIKYISKKSRIHIERKTDLSTIKHGLGLELFYFVDFVLNHSRATDEYKNFKRLNYLSPTEIMQQTKNPG